MKSLSDRAINSFSAAAGGNSTTTEKVRVSICILECCCLFSTSPHRPYSSIDFIGEKRYKKSSTEGRERQETQHILSFNDLVHGSSEMDAAEEEDSVWEAFDERALF